MFGLRPSKSLRTNAQPSDQILRWASHLVGLLTVMVLIKNAWVAEDAFIIFRVIEQLWAGNGPVFNVGERVQVFTSPLWFLLLAAGRTLTADPFLLVLGVSLALWLAIIALLRSIVGNHLLYTAGLLVTLLSSSFFDFTTSGLENILAYVVLLWTVGAFLTLHRIERASTPSNQVEPTLRRFLLGVGLCLLVRHDLLTLVAVPTLYTLLCTCRQISWQRRLRSLSYAALPLSLWTLFSVVYYGFPFPNTAYAKLTTAIPRGELLIQGAMYLVDAARYDTATVVVLGAAILIGCLRSTPASLRVLSLAIVANLGYLLWVGGDFMRGRFLSFSFVVALIVVLVFLRDTASPQLRRLALRTVAAALLIALALPNVRAPLTHPPRTVPISFHSGITDEKAYYFRTHRVLPNLRIRAASSEPHPVQQHQYAVDGTRFRDSGKSLAVADNIGTFAYYASLDQHVIDILGLADPLLARLPTKEGWWIGHFVRHLPAGYLDSVASGTNLIEQGPVQQFYGDLRQATRSPLFSRARWQAIIRLNGGAPGSRGIDRSYRTEDVDERPEVFQERLRR